jgi:hypothetical protein
MDTLAIVARYKEDVSWLKKLKIPYLIINKGPPIDDPNSISIENHIYGHEAHTYLWYIYNNYDNLPNKIIFLQGDPFDHQPQIIELLEPAMIEKMPEFQPLTLQYSEFIPFNNVRHVCLKYFENIPYSIVHFNDDMLDVYPSYYDFGLEHVTKSLEAFFHTLNTYSKRSLREKMHNILDVSYDEKSMTPYFFAAMFKINKDVIQKRPKEYYARMLEICDKCRVSGYLFERMWYALFCNANVKLSNEFEIIVSHYNESLKWLKEYQSKYLHIYSKGEIPRGVFANTHILPNIGRESHTYLTYIVNRYESLPNIVFFTKGNLAKYSQLKIPYFLNLHLRDFSSKNFTKNMFGCGLSSTYEIEHWNSRIQKAGIRGDEWFNTFVNPNIDLKTTEINIFWGAIFSVRKEAILKRSKEYYEQLLSQLTTDNPEIGHFIERSWYYIFNLDQFNYKM